jgi:hypothetical protein
VIERLRLMLERPRSITGSEMAVDLDLCRDALPALLDAAEAWREYLSAQRTIDKSLHMDNHRDAARARDTQAKAIDHARRALAALGVER